MSHVDEGALHAYLDGALEEYPAGEARRIRAHLERCARCARALAEARRARDDADMMLALPDLDVSAPPLEELKRLARSSSEEGGAGRRRAPVYRLRWVASVVLALGVGWLLRGGVPGASGPSFQDAPAPGQGRSADAAPDRQAVAEAPAAAAPVEERLAAAGALDRAEALAEPPSAVAAGAADELPEAPPAPSRLPEADVAEVVVAYDDAPQPADAVIDAMAAVAESVALSDEATPPASAEQSALAGIVATGAGARAPADTARADVASAASDTRVALETRSAGGTPLARTRAFEIGGREPGRRDADEIAEPGSLVVPGLDVISIVWREEGVVPAGVRVLQRLEDGSVLELIHLPAGFDPGAAEAADPGVGELVVPRDQGWLIMRAPLPEDALRSLLERMDAPPRR